MAVHVLGQESEHFFVLLYLSVQHVKVLAGEAPGVPTEAPAGTDGDGRKLGNEYDLMFVQIKYAALTTY